MSNFDEAVSYVLSNEGGLSVDPSDAGGTTNFGISAKQYPDLDIRALTRDAAIEIYRRDYWHPALNEIQSQRVATKLFDAMVNMGSTPAVRTLQLGLGAVEAGPIIADGVLGPRTVECVNAADEGRLIDEYKARLCKFYCELNNPSFLLGWLRRAVRG